MRTTRIANTVMLGLFLATSAFAANKGSMKLFDAASAAGKPIPPGEYSVTWEGNGPTVDVKIMQGNKIVATMPARLVDLKRIPDNDGTTTKSNSGQSLALTEIFFRGKRQALAIDSNAVEMAGQK
jgi:hypothetical protein